MAVVVDRENMEVGVYVLMSMDPTGEALRALANAEGRKGGGGGADVVAAASANSVKKASKALDVYAAPLPNGGEEEERKRRRRRNALGLGVQRVGKGCKEQSGDGRQKSVRVMAEDCMAGNARMSVSTARRAIAVPADLNRSTPHALRSVFERAHINARQLLSDMQ